VVIDERKIDFELVQVRGTSNVDALNQPVAGKQFGGKQFGQRQGRNPFRRRRDR
jgi:hypothetical protein